MELLNLRREIVDRARHGNTRPGRFHAAIALRSKATRLCLFLILKEENLMDDRNLEFESEPHQGHSDRTRDQFGVRRLPLQDDAEGKDSVEPPSA
jgi:hypothetical protein